MLVLSVATAPAALAVATVQDAPDARVVATVQGVATVPAAQVAVYALRVAVWRIPSSTAGCVAPSRTRSHISHYSQ
ncbi:MAG TPA: hypothetical protein VJ183_03690 [Chloroflexia bacterium]|nr:hypothetical protein [Chloroflexia bacterium]